MYHYKLYGFHIVTDIKFVQLVEEDASKANENNTITIQDGNMNGQTDSFNVAQSDWRTQTYSLSEFNQKRGGVVYANPIRTEEI